MAEVESPGASAQRPDSSDNDDDDEEEEGSEFLPGYSTFEEFSKVINAALKFFDHLRVCFIHWSCLLNFRKSSYYKLFVNITKDHICTTVFRSLYLLLGLFGGLDLRPSTDRLQYWRGESKV